LLTYDKLIPEEIQEMHVSNIVCERICLNLLSEGIGNREKIHMNMMGYQQNCNGS
jgi:hypothetical protein